MYKITLNFSELLGFRLLKEEAVEGAVNGSKIGQKVGEKDPINRAVLLGVKQGMKPTT